MRGGGGVRVQRLGYVTLVLRYKELIYVSDEKTKRHVIKLTLTWTMMLSPLGSALAFWVASKKLVTVVIKTSV